MRFLLHQRSNDWPRRIITRIIAYSLHIISNRSVGIHHKKDKKQVHSFLTTFIDNFLMALQAEVAQFLHLQL